MSFAAPEIEALYFPSWDCQPYDRVSPNAAVSAERMTVLARLAKSRGAVERPRILVASVNALTQRAPPLAFIASAAFSAAPGNSVRMEDLARWLESNGYARASTVRDVGDYASRGGILDLYPPGARRRSGSISSAIRSNRSAPSIRRRSARPRNCARSISCR